MAKGLPRNKALRRGKEIVDEYLEASYRIRKSKVKPKVQDDLNPPNLRKFRSPVPKSKLPRDTIIEMAKHRLDSAKEVQQISYFKELAARKKQLQTQIGFIKTQQKKQQLQTQILATKEQQQVSFISSSKSKKKKGKPIKFL